jgi:hypothetical protein
MAGDAIVDMNSQGCGSAPLISPWTPGDLVKLQAGTEQVFIEVEAMPCLTDSQG